MKVTRAASRARICRRRPSSPSCRTTTRSAIARSASGSPIWSPMKLRCSPQLPSCCSRPHRRCSSWARNGRRRSPFSISATSSRSSPEKVREGRSREFARFAKFQCSRHGGRHPGCRRRRDLRGVPASTGQARRSRAHAVWLDHYRRLLAIRRRDIVPRIPEIRARSCAKLQGQRRLLRRLAARGPLDAASDRQSFRRAAPAVRQPAGRMLFATHPDIRGAVTRNELAPWSVTWLFERAPERRAVDRARRKPQ